MSYYQPSGKFSAGRIPLGLLTGILLSTALAFIYVWLGHLIPFIIVKAILLAASLFVLLEIVKLCNRVSLNRNRYVTLFYVLINSITLLIFSWAFFIVFELGRGFIDALVNLPVYVKLVLLFQEYQVSSPVRWFIKAPGANVSGWETYVVLGAEALLLLFGSFIAIKTDHFDRMLFCESCNRWVSKKKVIKKEYLKEFTREELEAMLKKGDLSELMALPDSPENSKRFYEIRLYECDGCKSSGYIQIKMQHQSFSTKNENKYEVLIDYYLMDSELAAAVEGFSN